MCEARSIPMTKCQQLGLPPREELPARIGNVRGVAFQSIQTLSLRSTTGKLFFRKARVRAICFGTLQTSSQFFLARSRELRERPLARIRSRRRALLPGRREPI